MMLLRVAAFCHFGFSIARDGFWRGTGMERGRLSASRCRDRRAAPACARSRHRPVTGLRPAAAAAPSSYVSSLRQGSSHCRDPRPPTRSRPESSAGDPSASCRVLSLSARSRSRWVLARHNNSHHRATQGIPRSSSRFFNAPQNGSKWSGLAETTNAYFFLAVTNSRRYPRLPALAFVSSRISRTGMSA